MKQPDLFARRTQPPRSAVKQPEAEEEFVFEGGPECVPRALADVPEWLRFWMDGEK